MIQTTTVNLGGSVLHIDIDAYQTLDTYLKGIEGHLNTSDSKDEIMDDIEARIAELLQEHLKFSHRASVSFNMVKDVMAQLGSPEMITDGEDSETPTEATEEQKQDQEATTDPRVNDVRKKKFYRDIDNKKVCGVCSGLEAYTGIDMLWYRLAFVLGTVLLNGVGVVVYLVCSLIMPAADTAARRLDMRGIEPSAENIQREIERLKTSGREIKPKSDNNGCLTALLIGILILFCLPLIITAIAFVMPFFYWITSLPAQGINNLHHLEDLLIGNGALTIAGIILSILIPIIVLIIWGICHSSGKKLHPAAWIVAIVVWIASLAATGFGSFQLLKTGTEWLNNGNVSIEVVSSSYDEWQE